MRLELDSVTKRFRSLRGVIRALEGIDLRVEDGEFFVLLGPSGCGKSTLLNLVAGLEKPSEGRIRFDDQVVADAATQDVLSPRQRNVAFVFQDYALYPHLTVAGNLAFPLRVAGAARPEIDRAVRQAAATLEIAELLDAKPAELSGGQRQRVAIARAIVRNPRIFLMDEPLSNLDAQLRLAMRGELKRLQRRLGITTLYVTHDQIEAMSLGDRIAVLRRGAIEQIGTPWDLYECPASPFVARFVGSPPMNLVPVRLVAEGEGLAVELGAHRLALPPRARAGSALAPGDGALCGLRPEQIAVRRGSAEDALPATISSVEPMGREILLELECEGHLIRALSDDASLRPGEQVRVRLDLRKAHLFPEGA
ncbi:MAG: ATP-binding cassette domain-containing protein [Candidatus Eisenbacteria bacterium]|nr:ATP-binding cassette domain-containing protein [Candidatus Eisenbacteria bacterium]